MQMKDSNLSMFMLKKVTWNVNSGSNLIDLKFQRPSLTILAHLPERKSGKSFLNILII